MNLNQITKNIEEKNKQWDEILKGERKPNPNPELHPSKDIAKLLEQAYHHPEFPQDLDKRCKNLIEEVKAATPEFFPTLERYDADTPKEVIDHISSFLVRVQSPLTKKPGVIKEECRHSENFHKVQWYGQPYKFNNTQALIVELLWKAWEAQRTVHINVIAETISTDASKYRLLSSFRYKGKMHPAWNTMIKCIVGSDTYTLKKPKSV